MVADRESNEVLLISVCGKMPCTQGTRENPNPVARFRSHDGGETWTAYEDITEDIYSIFDNRADAVRSIFFGSGRICQSRLVKVKDYYRLYAALWTRDNNSILPNYTTEDAYTNAANSYGGVNNVFLRPDGSFVSAGSDTNAGAGSGGSSSGGESGGGGSVDPGTGDLEP